MIILTGKPGAGKDTQAALLAERAGYTVLSAGALLRGEAETDASIATALKDGRLVDDEVLVRIMEQGLQGQNQDRIILDNFPRRPSQAQWLLDYMKRSDRLGTQLVLLNLQVDNAVAAQRAAARHRADDTPAAFQKRLDIYEHEVQQTQQLLADAKVPVLDVDGDGTPEEVYSHLAEALKRVGAL